MIIETYIEDNGQLIVIISQESYLGSDEVKREEITENYSSLSNYWYERLNIKEKANG